MFVGYPCFFVIIFRDQKLNLKKSVNEKAQTITRIPDESDANE